MYYAVDIFNWRLTSYSQFPSLKKPMLTLMETLALWYCVCSEQMKSVILQVTRISQVSKLEIRDSRESEMVLSTDFSVSWYIRHRYSITCINIEITDTRVKFFKRTLYKMECLLQVEKC